MTAQARSEGASEGAPDGENVQRANAQRLEPITRDRTAAICGAARGGEMCATRAKPASRDKGKRRTSRPEPPSNTANACRSSFETSAAATAAVLAFGRAAVGRTTLRGRARKLAARTSPAYCAPWHARPQPALTCSRSSRRCRGAQASSWTHRATAAERRATLLLATRRAGSTSAAEADSMAAM